MRTEPFPDAGLSREEIARRDLGQTTISPRLVRWLVFGFVALIVVIPIVEIMAARVREDAGGGSAWSHLAVIPREMRAHLDAASIARASGAWQLVISTNRVVLAGLSAFERALEDESLIGRSLRPEAQGVLTGWLGAGNERVYPGLDGWLFYRLDVDYVTGHGFLDPAQMRRRVKGAPEWAAPPQPDPRIALLQFRDDLRARGISLLVVPTPTKSDVHPEMLTRRYAGATAAPRNQSYRDFVAGLSRDGVWVFDPAAGLFAAGRGGPQYLATDTHWRPEAMEASAELLARIISSAGLLTQTADPGYRIERVEMQNRGDVARMLDLPDASTLYPPESVWLRRILQPDGSLWRPSRDAEVLVLGDSFSNIYTLESMEWGTSAGFVEQLSYALRRPVDRLLQNDQGSFAVREMLQRDPARLDGKRIVVYQFAVRELMFGDWKVVRLPPAPP